MRDILSLTFIKTVSKSVMKEFNIDIFQYYTKEEILMFTINIWKEVIWFLESGVVS